MEEVNIAGSEQLVAAAGSEAGIGEAKGASVPLIVPMSNNIQKKASRTLTIGIRGRVGRRRPTPLSSRLVVHPPIHINIPLPDPSRLQWR